MLDLLGPHFFYCLGLPVNSPLSYIQLKGVWSLPLNNATCVCADIIKAVPINSGSHLVLWMGEGNASNVVIINAIYMNFPDVAWSNLI